MLDKGFFLTIFGAIVAFALLLGGSIWAAYHFGDHHTGNYSVVQTERKGHLVGKVYSHYCLFTLTDGKETFELHGNSKPCEDVKHGTVVRVNDGQIDQDFWTGKLAKVN
jgi:hypothetical protein